jgi:hydroxymethylbilane synthase
MRVRRLDEGAYDAVVLAVAGLTRIGLEGRISERLDPVVFPPAPGQGALALQAREEDAELSAAVRRMDDPGARATTTAERTCLRALGGGCSQPIGAYAWLVGTTVSIAAFVGSADGKTILSTSEAGTDPEQVGRRAAAALLAQGAGALLS